MKKEQPPQRATQDTLFALEPQPIEKKAPQKEVFVKNPFMTGVLVNDVQTFLILRQNEGMI